jgi:hypothetical protein
MKSLQKTCTQAISRSDGANDRARAAARERRKWALSASMWSRNDAEGGRLSAPALPNHADGAVLAWVSPASMPASDDLSQPASLRHKHGVAGDDFQTRLAPRIPCSGSHFGFHRVHIDAGRPPISRHPPGSSRVKLANPVLLSSRSFRHVISGSLALAFLAHT